MKKSINQRNLSMRQDYRKMIRKSQIEQKMTQKRMELEDIEFNQLISKILKFKQIMKLRQNDKGKLQCLIYFNKVFQTYNIINVIMHTQKYFPKEAEAEHTINQYFISDVLILLLKQQEKQNIIEICSKIVYHFVCQLKEAIMQACGMNKSIICQLQRIIKNFPYFRLKQDNQKILIYLLEIIYHFNAQEYNQEIIDFLVHHQDASLIENLSNLCDKTWVLQNKALRNSLTITSLVILLNIRKFKLSFDNDEATINFFIRIKDLTLKDLHQSENYIQFSKNCQKVTLISYISNLKYLKQNKICENELCQLFSYLQGEIVNKNIKYFKMLMKIIKYSFIKIPFSSLQMLLCYIFKQNDSQTIQKEQLKMKELMISMYQYHIVVNGNTIPQKQIHLLLSIWQDDALYRFINMLYNQNSHKFQTVFQIILVLLQNVEDKQETINKYFISLLDIKQFRAILISLSYEVQQQA